MQDTTYPQDDPLGDRIRRIASQHRAVEILDAWLAKVGNYEWTVIRVRGQYYVRTLDAHFVCVFDPCQPTPSAARIYAADSLAKEDPSLLEGIE